MIEYGCGVLFSKTEQVSDSLYLVDSLPRRSELLAFSEANPGIFYLSRHSVSCRRGTRHVTRYILRNVYPALVSARQLASEFVETPGWTYGTIARQCAETLGIDCKTNGLDNMLPAWHYQKCLPCYPNAATMYDLQGAYWQFLSHIPSPRVKLTETGFTTTRVNSSVIEKWQRMIAVIGQHKALRLAFVGANAAGWSESAKKSGIGTRTYCVNNGRVIFLPTLRGLLQSAMILAVRSTYEVTAMQSADSRSCYSNADCVVSQNPPTIWEDLGLAYSIKAYSEDGEVNHVHSMGAYKIGGFETGLYPLLKGTTCIPHIPESFEPDVLYHRFVLQPR